MALFSDNCQLARENGLEEATARSLYQMAIWKRETGQISEAIEHLSEARDICEKRSSARGVAKVDIQRAKIEILLGQWAIAASLLVDAERRGSELHDPEVVAAAQHQLGNVHHYQSNFDTAERHYDRSRVIRGDLGDVRGVAAILHQLAFMALKQRQFDAARQLVLESQKLWSSVDNIQGRALNDSLCYALCWIDGHHDEAIKHYASAERVFTRIGDSLNLARLEALASGHIDIATIHIRPDGGLNVLQRLAPGEVPFTLSSFLADSEGGAK
jgi:tetratricopeptide (TPR) repeat protein